MTVMMRAAAVALGTCVLAAGLLGGGEADAQSRCKATDPIVEYQVDVPKGAPGEGFVRHQLVSEYCPHEYRDRAYRRYKVIDERGRVLATRAGTLVPLSARHAYGGGRVIVYGREPGEALPYTVEVPPINRIMMPGLGSMEPKDRPVIVSPVVVGSPRVQPGASTTVSVVLYTGYSQERRVIEGLGGRAVFGTDTFGQMARPNVHTWNVSVADYVMPQYGDLLVQNMTAPDGTGVALLLDRTGEPISPPMGLVDLIRVPERDVGSSGGMGSPLAVLVSRVAPLGPNFPNQWLLMPLDRQGMPIPPIAGSIGYTLVRPADANDRPVWGAVYRGANGYEVALSLRENGRLPKEVRPHRYSALQTLDQNDGLQSYHMIGQLPETRQWTYVNYSNSSAFWQTTTYPTAQALVTANRQWQVAADAAARQRAAQAAAESAARAARDAENARSLAFVKFETDIKTNSICYSGNINDVAALGDDYLKRWFDKCGVPVDMVGQGRRVGASAQAFAEGQRQAQASARYYAELRAMGARNNGLAQAMSAYNAGGGGAPSDPWVAVRVTEGGRTTTQVMRQSDYDRRRP